ncbi:MAG TPA: hypothetical protein VEJ40_08540 [Pseudolabrys sp.]|nr:hypothetical protein [Pseudolabrys sp.]
MKKLLILCAAISTLVLFAATAPADAASRQADGAKNGQTTELSAYRYRHYYRGHYGYYHRHYYYRPYYRHYYYRPYYYYPYSYYYGPRYYYPYGYYPYYYRRPGIYFGFGW